ncbi:MAG TPA: hypothetical protein VNX22_05570 [Acidobacteriaceae bacterium]|nr:hypothetical protein [Acidobacteriaceae bacterium]
MTQDATTLTPEQIAAAIEAFLRDHAAAVVLEEGRVQFDMRSAQFTVNAEHSRCMLHIWSEQSNIIRRIVGMRERKGSLLLSTQRMGQAKPQSLELVSGSERKSPTSQATARARYAKLLERVLSRNFHGFTADPFRNTVDLQRSFGPAYARGVLHRGQSAWAVIGVGHDETPASIDNVLTIGILWLAHCREHAGGRRLFEGLRVIVPRGKADVSGARMRWLNAKIAKWELYELDAPSEELTQRDLRDCGNLETSFSRAPNEAAMRERFARSIEYVLSLVPEKTRVEVLLRASNEAAFLLHGLEFARVRNAFVGDSFSRTQQVLFGAGANETVLTEDTQNLFRQTTAELFSRRHAAADKLDPVYRMQPERWLESELRTKLDSLDTTIDGTEVYSQVPAFAASDRGVLDLVAATRARRLVVLELKVSEDMHLALQGLDYWIRVRQHHGANNDDFKRHGYFPSRELQPQPPLLYYVVPSLHLHPATEVVLRYFSPEVEWTLLGLDERWRDRISVVFRKRSSL